MPKIDESSPKKIKTKSKSQKRIKWSEFREEWKDCEACPLHQTRSRICLARGQVPCDVLFIGEAPGTSENVSGKPFDGPAGHLLDQIVDSALEDWPESDFKITFTNVVCCLPVDANGKKTVEPLAEHAKACSPRLIEFIEKVAQPKLVIFVGKYAAKYVQKFVPKERTWTSVEIMHPAVILMADIGQRGLFMQRTIVTLRDAFESLLEKP